MGFTTQSQHIIIIIIIIIIITVYLTIQMEGRESSLM
jgi:hypothetical protein